MAELDDDDIKDLMRDRGCSFNEAVAILSRRDYSAHDDEDAEDGDDMPW